MIGVYDSGLGGLAVLSHLRRRMPRADLVYLGDTAHLPYGEKSPALLLEYTRRALAFFRRLGASALVVACGTVSTAVLEDCPLSTSELPVFGVARPAVARALSLDCRRIAVLATEASINSGVYGRLLSGKREVLSLACPTLVPLAESGRTDPSDGQLLREIELALAPLRGFSPDCILLGCTHFPLFRESISMLYPRASLIDCGREAAYALDAERLGDGSGTTSYYVSGSPEAFCRAAGALLPPAAVRSVYPTVL